MGFSGRPRTLLRTLVLLYSFTAFLSFEVHAQEATPKPPEKPAEKKPEDSASSKKAENPAQIELLETRYRFEIDGSSRKEVHTRVRINSELGVRQFAHLNFDYNRSFESIEIPLVRITHPSGGTADILPSAITDNPNPAVVNAPAYQDVRVKSVRILGLQPGDLLEYRVVTTVTHHALAPHFWVEHTFDRTLIVSQEIFELDLPGNLNSTTRMSGVYNAPVPVIYVNVPWTSSQHSGEGNSVRSEYLWEVPATRILPVPVNEEGAPVPDVLLSNFSTWQDLVSRLADHFYNWPEDDRKEAAARLHVFAPTATTPDRMLRASYEFVSQKLATIDLPIGATGFRLRRFKEILDSNYATPEEKCSLLAYFAGLAGIKAQIVFAGASEAENQFARPAPLTHVFVIVSQEKKRFALDPSLEVAPFGLIAPQFRGKTALSLTVADAGDVQFANWSPIPIELPFPASQSVSVDATLSADGALHSKVRYTLRGDNELLLRVAFRQAPKEKWKDLAQLLSISDGFRGKVSTVIASDPYATREPFTLDYEITMPKFVDWSKKPVRIPALLPQIGLPDPPAKPATGPASSAIDLGTPLEVTTSMTLHLPPGTTVQTPTGTSVQRDYATFASQYAAKGPAITASRHIHFLLREVPADRATEYNAFLRAVQNDEAQDFTLVRAESPNENTRPNAPKSATPPQPAKPKP